MVVIPLGLPERGSASNLVGRTHSGTGVPALGELAGLWGVVGLDDDLKRSLIFGHDVHFKFAHDKKRMVDQRERSRERISSLLRGPWMAGAWGVG